MKFCPYPYSSRKADAWINEFRNEWLCATAFQFGNRCADTKIRPKKYCLLPISAAPYTAFGSLSPAPLRGHHTVEFNRKYSKNGSEFPWKFLKQIRRLGFSVLCKNLSISQKSTKQIWLLAAPPRHRICFKNFQGNSLPFFAKYTSLDEGSLERFKIYVMNGSLVQWGGGGKKHAAKSMRGLRGVAEIAANIKKESMNLGI